LDNYQYDFETYGISYGLNELKVCIEDLQNKITTLWAKGYTVDPDESTDEDEEYDEEQDDESEEEKSTYND